MWFRASCGERVETGLVSHITSTSRRCATYAVNGGFELHGGFASNHTCRGKIHLWALLEISAGQGSYFDNYSICAEKENPAGDELIGPHPTEVVSLLYYCCAKIGAQGGRTRLFWSRKVWLVLPTRQRYLLPALNPIRDLA